MRARTDQMVHQVHELVVAESPSADLAACAATAAVVDRLGAACLGRPAERVVRERRIHLRWRLGPLGQRPVLLLGHYDTVWPLGTIARLPWSIEHQAGETVMRGPGCFDMKAGLVQMFHAAAAVSRAVPITVLVTGDEEIGSPTSRGLIEDEAIAARAALVFEGSADGGALKVGRKGVSQYVVHTIGRAAHAGLEPHKGVNASLEVARQVIALCALSDDSGTTVTPTLLAAGSSANTVPAKGQVTVDVRTWSSREQLRVDKRIRGLTPSQAGSKIVVEGGINRPPLETSQARQLLDCARRVSHDLLGTALDAVAVGGASDGNFTAGVGTSTLDGLGAVGSGAHADSEHVLVRHMPDRAALVAALVRELTT